MLCLLIAFTTTQASARTPIRSQSATITHFSFAKGSSLSQMKISGGQISLDYFAGEVTLSLQPAFECPGKMICAQVMPAPIEVTLPLVHSFTDRCGTVHFTAKRDSRPVDGLNEVIRVSDHTRNTCPTLTILPATSVSYVQQGYNRINRGEFKFVHTFTAEALR